MNHRDISFNYQLQLALTYNKLLQKHVQTKLLQEVKINITVMP